jgi:hypothetical protein
MLSNKVSEVKDILLNTVGAAEVFVGQYQDYVPGAYPAVCIEPNYDGNKADGGLGGSNFTNSVGVILYYIEEAPEDRSQEQFIGSVDDLISTFETNNTLNGSLNNGLDEILAQYMRRQTTDNLELISKLKLEGRNY